MNEQDLVPASLMGLVNRRVPDILPKSSAFKTSFNMQQSAVFINAVVHGWHESPVKFGASHIDVKLRKMMLIVGEVSEAAEALRDGNPESAKIPGFSCEEEEMADIVLRCMDYAQKEALNLSGAIEAKHVYNVGRPFKHGGKAI